MQLLLDIPQKKAEFVKEMLRNFKYIKTTAVKPKTAPSAKREVKPKKRTEAEFLEDFRHAIEELNEVKAGRKQDQDAREFLKQL